MGRLSGARETALVTGGAGFIGSHLVDRLASEGWSVRVLDDFSSGSERNLADARGSVEVVRGDLCDRAALDRALRGVDVVFHHAAIPSVPRSVDDPLRCHEVNLTGTLRLLEAARAAGVRRLVLASSCAVYGDDERLPKSECMQTDPVSPYAFQKLGSEHYLELYHRLFGLETVALRYFNVFGPRQDPASDYAAVIPLFVSRGLGGEEVQIHGDGEQTRDFVYVGDVVEANLLAASAPEAAGQLVNVASGTATSVNELVEVLASATGRTLKIRHGPGRQGDILHSQADISRARELLDYAPRVSFDEGVRRTIEYFSAPAVEKEVAQ